MRARPFPRAPSYLHEAPPACGGVAVYGRPFRRSVPAPPESYLAAHTVSIREVEHSTGLDLVPTLVAEALKKAVVSELWLKN